MISLSNHGFEFPFTQISFIGAISFTMSCKAVVKSVYAASIQLKLEKSGRSSFLYLSRSESLEYFLKSYKYGVVFPCFNGFCFPDTINKVMV